MLSIHSVPTEVSNGYLMKPHFPNTKFKCAAYIKIILYRQRGKISVEMRFHVSSHDVYEKFLNLFLFLSSPHKQPINQILFFCSHSTAVNTNRSQIHISFILTRKRFATRVIMERYESTNFIFIFFYEILITELSNIFQLLQRISTSFSGTSNTEINFCCDYKIYILQCTKIAYR